MDSLLLLVLITAFVASFIKYFIFYKTRPNNFPPGPSGIPIFGNAFQLGRQSYYAAMDLQKKFGDIIGFKMGSVWAVYLHDAEDIRELFGRSEMTGKKYYNGVLDEFYGKYNYGVLLSEGKTWQEQRRFCLRTLRDFGFGKKTMESIILEEVTQLVVELKMKVNQPMCTKHEFNSPVFNVIWSIVAGERFSHNDPRLEEIMKLLVELLNTLFDGMKGFFFIFPKLEEIRNKMPFLFFDAGLEFREKILHFLQNVIDDHKNTMTDGNPRDLIDTYLEEMNKNSDPDSSFYPTTNDDFQLKVLLMDLFIGGTETTSSILQWSFFLLALHEEAQERFYKEIQNAVGNRVVEIRDRQSLPYVEATIMEIMRVSTITPIGSPHTASEDQLFKGYSIPKDTVCIANIYAVHYRKDIWGDPHVFRPERFLSSDEKTVMRNTNIIPFSLGKRSCLGETLAKAEIFLFLTNLCQQFRIGMPQGEPEHTMKLSSGAVPLPEPHRILLVERNV